MFVMYVRVISVVTKKHTLSVSISTMKQIHYAKVLVK